MSYIHGDIWHIYFIEASNGFLKIGTSQNPHGRAECITSASPLPARLIATWEAPRRHEAGLHEQFKEYRAHNEWFRCEGALAEYVSTKRGIGVQAIAEWADIDGTNRFKRKALSKDRRSEAAKRRWAAPGYKEKMKKWRQTLRNSPHRKGTPLSMVQA